MIITALGWLHRIEPLVIGFGLGWLLADLVGWFLREADPRRKTPPRR